VHADTERAEADAAEPQLRFRALAPSVFPRSPGPEARRCAGPGRRGCQGKARASAYAACPVRGAGGAPSYPQANAGDAKVAVGPRSRPTSGDKKLGAFKKEKRDESSYTCEGARIVSTLLTDCRIASRASVRTMVSVVNMAALPAVMRPGTGVADTSLGLSLCHVEWRHVPVEGCCESACPQMD